MIHWSALFTTPVIVQFLKFLASNSAALSYRQSAARRRLPQRSSKARALGLNAAKCSWSQRAQAFFGILRICRYSQASALSGSSLGSGFLYPTAASSASSAVAVLPGAAEYSPPVVVEVGTVGTVRLVGLVGGTSAAERRITADFVCRSSRRRRRFFMISPQKSYQSWMLRFCLCLPCGFIFRSLIQPCLMSAATNSWGFASHPAAVAICKSLNFERSPSMA